MAVSGFTWRETFGGQADLEDVRRNRRQAERKKIGTGHLSKASLNQLFGKM